MAFVQIIPRSRSTNGDIKISFTGSKTVYANVYFSFDILERLKWGKECRVRVYFDDEVKRKWMIEKVLDDDKSSFKIIPNQNKTTKISKLQFKFSECEIGKEDRKIKKVLFDIIENKIIING